MLLKSTDRQIRIVGVALEGRDGSPVVVFEVLSSGTLLPIPADPFDAEIIIREFAGESGESAVGWLGDLLCRNPPRRGRIEADENGRPGLRFPERGPGIRGDRFLSFGEGLALCRRLEIPLVVDENLIDTSRDELHWLSSTGAFFGDFLYLSPLQYAPGIPLE